MSGLCEINMTFDECLNDAKARLVMVAFLKFDDEDNEKVMKILEDLSKENKRLVILAVDATRNMGLARQFNVTACPTFLFFRNRVLMGSRVTTRETKLRKDVEKYSKVFVAVPQQFDLLFHLGQSTIKMPQLYEVDMCLDDCLISAKARLVMVAFVDLKDEENAEVMKMLEEVSRENKRLVILVVNATKNMGLARQLNVTACPTFLFFRNRQLLGSRVTTKEAKLKKDVAKYNQIFLSSPHHYNE
ncbi:hypothetical protein AAHC03_016587 [Spirometra sp. Aus1]